MKTAFSRCASVFWQLAACMAYFTFLAMVQVTPPPAPKLVSVEPHGTLTENGVTVATCHVQYGPYEEPSTPTPGEIKLSTAIGPILTIGQVHFFDGKGWSRVFYELPEGKNHLKFMEYGPQALKVRQKLGDNELPPEMQSLPNEMWRNVGAFVVFPANGSIRIYLPQYRNTCEDAAKFAHEFDEVIYGQRV